MTRTSVDRGARRLCGVSGLAAAVALLGACASAPPAPSLAAAQDAIARAEESGARQYAGSELDEARQQLTLAESAVRDERMIDASRLAERSELAAELASARTESAKAEEINRNLDQASEALAEEMRRMGEQR
jgi:hypothetical protein